MALKALDQRMAGSSNSNLNNSPFQAPRAPPPAASKSESAMPSSTTGKERQSSVDKADIGETTKPNDNDPYHSWCPIDNIVLAL